MPDHLVMVTGHRPQKLGGYGGSPTQFRVRVWLRGRLVALKQRHGAQLVAISGMALGVDQWFAEEALALGIPFDAYVPCDGQDSTWPRMSQLNYRAGLGHARNVIVVSPGPYAAWKMQRRNEAMVDAAQDHLAVRDGEEKGGTWNCVRYMRQKGVEPVIFNPRSATR